VCFVIISSDYETPVIADPPFEVQGWI